jgi:high-affinity Fe2+/Pb2+ permease
MKKIKFILYGLLIGAICAFFGSLVFALFLMTVFFGTDAFHTNLFDFFMALGIVTFYCLEYAILPGALGGAYLARWLEKAERTPKEVTQRGLIVGAAAGLAASAATILFFYRSSVYDWALLLMGYTALAALVAAGMSWFAARWLARKKPKFAPVVPQDLSCPSEAT